MSALPGLAQVILGYQSDSSSKRPGLSIALDLGTRVKPMKPPDPRIGALTRVAPYQLGGLLTSAGDLGRPSITSTASVAPPTFGWRRPSIRMVSASGAERVAERQFVVY